MNNNNIKRIKRHLSKIRVIYGFFIIPIFISILIIFFIFILKRNFLIYLIGIWYLGFENTLLKIFF